MRMCKYYPFASSTHYWLSKGYPIFRQSDKMMKELRELRLSYSFIWMDCGSFSLVPRVDVICPRNILIWLWCLPCSRKGGTSAIQVSQRWKLTDAKSNTISVRNLRLVHRHSKAHRCRHKRADRRYYTGDSNSTTKEARAEWPRFQRQHFPFRFDQSSSRHILQEAAAFEAKNFHLM